MSGDPDHDTVPSSTETWDVDDRGNQVPISEAPRPIAKTQSLTEAEIRSMDMNTKLRANMTMVLATIFIGLNIGVGTLVYIGYVTDVELLRAKIIMADQRLITEKAYLALIGATVIQVGAGIAAILAYLFPKGK